jgi:hypothetical protein
MRRGGQSRRSRSHVGASRIKRDVRPAIPRSAAGVPQIKERLLAVASDLFYRCGVRAVSVDEIVKAAGVPPNRYYPKLFFAIHLLH